MSKPVGWTMPAIGNGRLMEQQTGNSMVSIHIYMLCIVTLFDCQCHCFFLIPMIERLGREVLKSYLVTNICCKFFLTAYIWHSLCVFLFFFSILSVPIRVKWFQPSFPHYQLKLMPSRAWSWTNAPQPMASGWMHSIVHGRRDVALRNSNCPWFLVVRFVLQYYTQCCQGLFDCTVYLYKKTLTEKH